MSHLLFIGSVWPEPKSSASGSRTLQLIEVFRYLNYNITFASACEKISNAFDLKSIDVNQVSIQLNDNGFNAFVEQLSPSVIVFDRFMTEEQFGWRVSESCPKAIKILDTQDLHCLRKGREQAFKAHSPFNTTFLFSDIAKREIASIYRCDLSLIISEFEMDLLQNTFKVPSSLFCYVPFLLEKCSKEKNKRLTPFDKRADFMTIGNFLHPPNYDAVLYLKNHIWPLIRAKLPEANLHIYGSYVSQKVMQMHNKKERFMVRGFVKDVNEVMQQARICLIPLRFGAGLKGKLFDAMQNGTPSVMTPIAAEAVFANLNPNGFITNNPEDFTQKAVELYQNEVLWYESQNCGFKVINERFDKEQFYISFKTTLRKLVGNLEQHRMNNFTGTMLQHHTLQSTKFMSRWIEEKNKRSNSQDLNPLP